MASTKKAIDFRTLLADIKSGNIAPVNILMGEEAYYIDKLVEAFEAYTIKEEEKDFNFSVYYGQEINIPTVIASCQQYPFMADRKLVILKEAQSMDRAKSKLDEMAPYVKNPNEQNILVIVYKGESLRATSQLIKDANSSNTVIFNSPRLREYQIAAPIREYCRSKKIGVDEKALAMLTEFLGCDLQKIMGEIDKLIVAGGGKIPQITPEMVEKNIGVSKDFNNFELSKALAFKNYDRSLQIVQYFSSNPSKNPTVMTTSTLFNFFSKVLMGLFAPDKSDDGLMYAMGLNNKYALGEYKTAMVNYNPNQVVKIIGYIREFDAQSKGIDSFQNEYQLLKELIFKIFTAR